MTNASILIRLILELAMPLYKVYNNNHQLLEIFEAAKNETQSHAYHTIGIQVSGISQYPKWLSIACNRIKKNKRPKDVEYIGIAKKTITYMRDVIMGVH